MGGTCGCRRGRGALGFGVLSPGRTPLALFIEGWDEGYTGINGWAIAGGGDGASPDAPDAAEAGGLYRLLQAARVGRLALSRPAAGRMFREYAETRLARAARDASAGAGDRAN